ncbi:MAG: type IV secretion system DNA-binding domain-containing protein [Planctomycetota bacterium]|jgi:conjugal transfer pilus assembly protein TraD
MNRALLVAALASESGLLLLEAPGLPYSDGVRVAACAFGILALVLVVVPALARRRAGREVLGFGDIPPDRVLLGRGSAWGLEQAQGLMADPDLRPGREELSLPVSVLDQHLLICGTTGCGKTRMLEVLIAHAILRGEAVVVIDPKGDERLLRSVSAACRAAGRATDFRFLSLPHPGKSVRYNPVGQFADVREVADRVAALLPEHARSAPFRSYAWEVVYTVARALVAAEEPVTLRALKKHAVDEPWELVRRLIVKHSGGALHGPDGARLAKTYERKLREGKAEPCEELTSLIALARRPREHYQKMVAALVPVLTKLTANPVLDGDELKWEEVAEGRVVYFHLGSLLGFESASAVAKMALLDAASWVGRRYAYAKGREPLCVFVDEAADVVTRDFIPVLNKGRGAGLRISLCVQTAADLEAALGSRAPAAQVMGNVSTVVQFRAGNAADADVFSQLAGERLLALRGESERYEPALFSSGFRSVDDFRAMFGSDLRWTNQPVVPPWAVTELPRFCFFARTPDGLFLGRAPLLEVDGESDVPVADRSGGGDGAGVVVEPAAAGARPVGI